MCGAQTRCPGDSRRELQERRRLLEGGRHRLLDEHVLAGRKRRARERPVLVHARQHEHEIDVVALDHGLGTVSGPGSRPRPQAGRAALALVDVVDGA